MSEVQNNFIPNEVLKSFSGRSLIRATELSEKMAISIQAVIDHCLHGEIPIYVMWDKKWQLNLIAGDPPILNEEEASAYSLLKIGANDIAMILANGSANVSELTDQYGCQLLVVGIEANGKPTPVKSLTISTEGLLVRYSEFSQTEGATELGKKAEENLLRTIAALACTAAYFYEKAFDDGKLGVSPKINNAQLIGEIHDHLTQLDFSLYGLKKSVLSDRITKGLELLKKS